MRAPREEGTDVLSYASLKRGEVPIEFRREDDDDDYDENPNPDGLRPLAERPVPSARRKRARLGLGPLKMETGRTVKYKGFLIRPFFSSDRGGWRAEIEVEGDAKTKAAQEKARRWMKGSSLGQGGTEASAVSMAKDIINGDYGQAPDIHELDTFIDNPANPTAAEGAAIGAGIGAFGGPVTAALGAYLGSKAFVPFYERALVPAYEAASGFVDRRRAKQTAKKATALKKSREQQAKESRKTINKFMK